MSVVSATLFISKFETKRRFIMNERIYVNSQKELDDFLNQHNQLDKYDIYICFGTIDEPAILLGIPHAFANESYYVEAHNGTHLSLSQRATGIIFDESYCSAKESSKVLALEHSSIVTHDVACATLRNNASGKIYSKATTSAYDDAHVVCTNNAVIKAADNVTVETFKEGYAILSDTATCKTHDKSSAIATAKNKIEAYDESKVVGRGCSEISLHNKASAVLHDASKVISGAKENNVITITD